MIPTEVILLTGFLILILTVLMIDLLVVGRNSHIVSAKEALIWSSIWFALSMGFFVFLKFYGHLLHGIDTPEELTNVISKYASGLKFHTTDYEGMLAEYRNNMSMGYLAGYFIEQTLSVDNVFVILLVLQSFSVPQKNYKTVLFWGVLGAIILRFIFIFTGAALIHKFSWILYVFGAFLIFQGIKILFSKDEEQKDPHDSVIFRFFSKYLNISKDYHGDKFAYKYNKKVIFTPLMVVVILVEFTDVIFALDSIPAVFSVSLDPFVVFFSNIFAIIGLRSLFFLLANMVSKFRFLNVGVSVLLSFVGLKLLLHNWLDDIGFKTSYSLYFIAATLVLSVLFSVIFPEKETAE
ncbi:MAG TPA: TerC/Alx family metal homeostasis membrane protein [Prolixibacteraceae bacterium]|nr:TerC/Alx family metal homeostasis membrane protein [Prolixibacteraceae bacterium]